MQDLMQEVRALLHGITDEALRAHWMFAGLTINPVTMRLVWNLLWDLPLSPAESTDFGVASDDHHRALQAVVRHGCDNLGSGVEEDPAFREAFRRLIVEIDQAYGNGPAITKLVHKYATWQGLTFETPWDVIMDGGMDDVEVPF